MESLTTHNPVMTRFQVENIQLPTRVAIYARHSTDKQSKSTQDQIDKCTEYCRQAGYRVGFVFSDEAVSGASIINRDGFSDMIDAALYNCFDKIVAEDLSRISRDQGDMAHFYRKLCFMNIGLETVDEGEINELHIGLKGTMNALYLKDLADKTRRGMIAAVLKGSIPGGRTYGYDSIVQYDAQGEPIRGLRRINEQEAETVRWIFDLYESGATLHKIVRVLNLKGIPSPKGGEWVKTTLVGQLARGTGLLRQTLYKGVVTFNRMMYRKNPDTGRRQSFVRPVNEWLQVPVPELAIIDEGQFDRVQKIIEERSSMHKQRMLLNKGLNKSNENKPQKTYSLPLKSSENKPARTVRLYLFSGKLWCADHDARISVIRTRVYNCEQRRCHLRNVKHEDIADGMLEALKQVDISHINAGIVSLHQKNADLQGQVKELEQQIEEQRAEIRSILQSLGQGHRSQELILALDDREADILKLKFQMNKQNKELLMVNQVIASSPETLLEAFKYKTAPLYGAPDNQAVVRRIYPWFERFSIAPIDGAKDNLKVEIRYNWQKILLDLMKTKS